MSYYSKHLFFCLNQRPNGQACCAQQGAEAAFDHCKKRLKLANATQNVSDLGPFRVNRAGCLDRCAAGPVLVIYPEAVWYTFVNTTDIDEIVDTHILQGKIVERLLIPKTMGR